MRREYEHVEVAVVAVVVVVVVGKRRMTPRWRVPRRPGKDAAAAGCVDERPCPECEKPSPGREDGLGMSQPARSSVMSERRC